MVKNTKSTIKDYMTPKETAELLRVSPITIRVWAQKGLLLASTTAGGHRRFERSEIERFAREKGIKIDLSAPPRVLIVDDDQDHLDLLKDFFALRLTEMEVETAMDGFEAGQKVESFKPDIILLDLLMPGMDGFKVCQAIKENPSSKNVRIIAISGFMSDENRRKIRGTGAEICLQKPLDLDRLAVVVGEQAQA